MLAGGTWGNRYLRGYKKLILLGMCLVALASSPVIAQAGAPDSVVMQVRENGVGNVRVILAYPGGKTEEQDFKAGFTDKAQKEAVIEYQQLLTRLYQQGYTLKGTLGPGNSPVQTLIFVKGQ
jgi:hypothetical protein